MRQRVTISVPTALLKEAERLGKRLKAANRSAVVVLALERLVRQVRSDEIDASLDAYYGGLTQEERDEERAMVRAFERSRRKLGLDTEGR